MSALAQSTVSIILPTYNRARFLPQAFASIRSQRFTDWELIVVDDGSTDETCALVPRLTADMPQPARYIYQENQGPADARNAGLDHAVGKYVAFFDSDDEWLPHHLAECVAGLDACPDVDWVYGACQVVEDDSGRVITPNTFVVQGKPRPFRALRSRRVGGLNVIEDREAVCCMFRSGLRCGLQASVIRRTVFDAIRFPPFRVGEDRVLAVLALKAGYRLGYFEDVHCRYRIHDANTSSTSTASSTEKQVQAYRSVIDALESIHRRCALTPKESRLLRRRIAREYFWHLGYSTLWTAGRRSEALQAFRNGIRLDPFSARCWKTYLLASMRSRWTVGATVEGR